MKDLLVYNIIIKLKIIKEKAYYLYMKDKEAYVKHIKQQAKVSIIIYKLLKIKIYSILKKIFYIFYYKYFFILYFRKMLNKMNIKLFKIYI